MEKEVGHIKVECIILADENSPTQEAANFSIDVSCRFSDYAPFLDNFLNEVAKENGEDGNKMVDAALMAVVTKRMARNYGHDLGKIDLICDALKERILHWLTRQAAEKAKPEADAPKFTDSEQELAMREAQAIMRGIAKRGDA